MEMTEERTVLDAYLEMTGSSRNKGQKGRDSWGNRTEKNRTVTEKKLQNQSLLTATVQYNRTSLQGSWLMKREGHTVTWKQVN